MRVVLILQLLLAFIPHSKSQTITHGKYGPDKSVFWGTLLTFKENNAIEVRQFGCIEQKYGIGSYDLKDSVVSIRFSRHPGDTLAPFSSVSYSEIEKTDSINVSYRLLDWGSPVWIHTYTINDSVYNGWKVTDTTKTLHFKIPVSELPCTIKVTFPNYDNVPVYINNPFDCDIVTYSTLFYKTIQFFQANDSMKFYIENITDNSFVFIIITLKASKRIPCKNGRKNKKP